MEDDKVAILLEDLNSQFQIFGEGLELTNKKLDTVIEDVNYLKEKDIEKTVMILSLQKDMKSVKKDQQEMKKDISIIKKDQQEMKKDQWEMKKDISIVKIDLKEVKQDISSINQKIIIHDKKLNKV